MLWVSLWTHCDRRNKYRSKRGKKYRRRHLRKKKWACMVYTLFLVTKFNLYLPVFKPQCSCWRSEQLASMPGLELDRVFPFIQKELHLTGICAFCLTKICYKNVHDSVNTRNQCTCSHCVPPHDKFLQIMLRFANLTKTSQPDWDFEIICQRYNSPHTARRL